MFFIRAPEGKTIAQESTTISLSPKGAGIIQEVVAELRNDHGIRTKLSKRDVEKEVVTALFQGTEALEQGNLDAGALADGLLGRLSEGRDTWNVYLPIVGIELPEGQSLSLAGGSFKSLTTGEKQGLMEECVAQLKQAQWQSPQKQDSGVRTLTQDLDEIINSSKYWFHIAIEGRPDAAKELAVEAATLGMDILLFWGLLVGINPEMSSLGLPTQSKTQGMRAFQIASEGSQFHHEGPPVAFPYKLDEPKFARLTKFIEFKKTQDTSNSPQPSEVGQKILMGIQQFSEAARLSSATLKLVWYLSALETVLAKEKEGTRHEKVERRIKKLLNGSVASWVGPLYEKRRRPVHYGQRNRLADELVTDTDFQRARILAYRGIVHAV
ncbi:MAG: hypothetical protein AAB037_05585, partial [Chloroflexota bacterium]